MKELHLPWLELSVALLIFGSLLVRWVRPAYKTRWVSLGLLAISLLFNLSAWFDFATTHAVEAHDRWDALHAILGVDLLVIDEFSAPLLMLTSLHSFLTVLSTLRTKIERVPYSGILAAQGITQAIFCTKSPWFLIGLLALSTLPPWVDLIRRGKPSRVFVIHMTAHVALLVAGWSLVSTSMQGTPLFLAGGVLLVISILIRSGVAPLHCWMTDLFEHASFGSAILFVTPMAGAYAAVRLVVPHAPDWSLQWMAFASFFTSVYASGMALVQREARRFYCYLFLSHASLVLVGLETATAEALTGGLCVWFSASLSLTGFGLTLRAVEARLGRLSLRDYHGLYDHMPNLAVLFLITGLASVGFPGTIGFVSSELLVDGIIHVYPWLGVAVVIASAMNGIAIIATYFRLFTGTKHMSTISLQSRLQERLAVISLLVIMIGGGIAPQPFIASRESAAEHIIQDRAAHHPDSESPPAKSRESAIEEEVESEEIHKAAFLPNTATGVAVSLLAQSEFTPVRALLNPPAARGPTRIRNATNDH